MSAMAKGSNQRGNRLAIYSRPRVLVAHGEHVVCQGLAGILRRAAYDVDEAANFDEARASLDKGQIGALVMSIRLPPDGYLPLLAACKGLPPIVLLAGSDDEVGGAAEDWRVGSVLTRPLRLQALYDAVAGAMSQPKTL
jgi:DNA-binding NtrC family response regulator